MSSRAARPLINAAHVEVVTDKDSTCLACCSFTLYIYIYLLIDELILGD